MSRAAALSPEDAARADALHADALVIDLLNVGPFGPCTYPAPLAAEVERVREADPWRAFLHAARLPLERAIDGLLPEYEPAWRRSGVDVATREVVFDTGVEVPLDEAIAFTSLGIGQFRALPWLDHVRTGADARRAKAAGRCGAILATHHIAALTGVERLRAAARLGLTLVQVTSNHGGHVGGGCLAAHDAGLTPLGREWVAALRPLGMLADVTHAGPRTTAETCALAGGPVVASHTACRAVAPGQRAKGDDELRAIAETGGLVGITLAPFVLGRSAVGLDRVLDHVEHAARVAGWEHVCIGTDWPPQLPASLLRQLRAVVTRAGYAQGQGPAAALPAVDGVADLSELVNVTRGLVARGHSEARIRGVLGENVLRVLDELEGLTARPPRM